MLNTTQVFSTQHNSTVAKADSGASTHSFSMQHIDHLTNIQTLKNGPKCKLPNGKFIQPKQQGELTESKYLSTTAKKVHIHDEIKNVSLISIGQLCDDGCEAKFDKQKLVVTKNKDVVMKGTRNVSDGLWDIKLDNKKPVINAIVRKDMAKTKLANYLHACAGSPALSTFQRAINNGNFLSWPNIDEINFLKFLPNQEATAKGHLDQERQGIQSTREDFNPTQQTKTNQTVATAFQFTPKELSYSDQTGKFPYQSSRGYEYVMVIYDYDSNAILARPFKNRQAKELVNTWTKLFNDLTRNGHTTENFIMDNECSKEMKTALTKYKMNYQLVPPDSHRRNAAERAIRTFKNHFLSCLATCHKHFPIREWDRLLPQAVMTLNMLRNTRLNPKLSSHAYLFGQHNFAKNPLAPFGAKIMIHNKSDRRGSWQYHSYEGWYVGPSFEHYRCYRCYNPTTRSEIVSDTVQVIEDNIPVPITSIDEYLKQAVDDILQILKKPQKSKLPFLQYGNDTNTAITQIAELIQNATNHPASDVAKQTRVANDIKQKIKNLPKPSTKKQPLDIMKELRNSTKSNERKSSLKCPHESANEFVKKKSSKKEANKNKVTTQQDQWVTTQSIPNVDPYSHYYNYVHPPVYLYPNANVRLPYAPMANRRMQSLFHIFDDTGKKLSIDQLINGKDADKWNRGLDNELGRLADGIPNRIVGTKTINFIRKQDVPRNKKVTYANFVCDFRELKEEQYRVRMTLGGDKLEYTGETASPATNLLETKILVNSVISDAKKGARFMSLDIKDFFLQSNLPEKEYLRIHKRYFSNYFRQLYGLDTLIDKDGYIYCEILKGMYGLKQAAILAYKKLKDILENAGYKQIENTTGLWTHRKRKLYFALCVDDFGIKYFGKDDMQHLIKTLQDHYVITIDIEGKNYCGLTFDWHYDKNYVDVKMPGYIEKALSKYGHKPPKKPQYAPHVWAAKFYGKSPQQATPEDTSKQLNNKDKTKVQSQVGTFLYYGRAIDQTILPALGEISIKQSKPTEKTKSELKMLMDYLSTYPNAVLRFYAGDMQLKVESDAAYLVLPGAKSRIAGYYVLSNTTNREKSSPIFIECKAIRHVVCSAAEAETHGLFTNCQNTIIIRNALNGLGHKQNKTVVISDNTTSTGYVNKTMKEKKSKTWDMRYNWLRDDIVKKIISVKWKRGKENMADYFTKNHPPSYHKEKRRDYILKGYSIQTIANVVHDIVSKTYIRARVC